jgi:hypothetical protein
MTCAIIKLSGDALGNGVLASRGSHTQPRRKK